MTEGKASHVIFIRKYGHAIKICEKQESITKKKKQKVENIRTAKWKKIEETP